MDESIAGIIKDIEHENDRQNHRIDVLEKKIDQINDIVISIKELSTNMQYMMKSQEKMEADIEEIKSKPGEKWEKAAWLVVAAVLGAAVGFILNNIGL